MKKILILGSTGSIGTNTVEVIKNFKDTYKIVGLSGFNNTNLLEKQIIETSPEFVGIKDLKKADELKIKFPKITFFSGPNFLTDLAEKTDYDIIVVSVVGAVGLKPVISAIKRSKKIAIANKEPLVIAGQIIMPLSRKYNSSIIPVDSEHSAIFQCLHSGKHSEIEKILLTASGGPFFKKNLDFNKIKPEDALAHPNWSMGSKITIDSATLMNKGLELIEARWLFDVIPEKIQVVVHPQSIIHSMIEFIDGSIIAQLGTADMKFPIQYALSYPERLKNNFKKINFFNLTDLTFDKPDLNKFRCLKLAINSIKSGGIYPTILNAANEIAVYSFLDKKISFSDISVYIESALEKFENINNPELEQIFEMDLKVREFIKNKLLFKI